MTIISRKQAMYIPAVPKDVGRCKRDSDDGCPCCLTELVNQFRLPMVLNPSDDKVRLVCLTGQLWQYLLNIRFLREL